MKEIEDHFAETTGRRNFDELSVCVIYLLIYSVYNKYNSHPFRWRFDAVVNNVD